VPSSRWTARDSRTGTRAGRTFERRGVPAAGARLARAETGDGDRPLRRTVLAPVRRARLGDLVHDLHAGRDAADDRVDGGQAGRVAVQDEELAAVGVRPGVRQGHDPAGVADPGRVLVGEPVAGAAAPRAGRVAALEDLQ